MFTYLANLFKQFTDEKVDHCTSKSCKCREKHFNNYSVCYTNEKKETSLPVEPSVEHLSLQYSFDKERPTDISLKKEIYDKAEVLDCKADERFKEVNLTYKEAILDDKEDILDNKELEEANDKEVVFAKEVVNDKEKVLDYIVEEETVTDLLDCNEDKNIDKELLNCKEVFTKEENGKKELSESVEAQDGEDEEYICDKGQNEEGQDEEEEDQDEEDARDEDNEEDAHDEDDEEDRDAYEEDQDGEDAHDEDDEEDQDGEDAHDEDDEEDQDGEDVHDEDDEEDQDGECQDGEDACDENDGEDACDEDQDDGSYTGTVEHSELEPIDNIISLMQSESDIIKTEKGVGQSYSGDDNIDSDE